MSPTRKEVGPGGANVGAQERYRTISVVMLHLVALELFPVVRPKRKPDVDQFLSNARKGAQRGTIDNMQSKRIAERSFRGKIEGTEKGRVYLVLPFDPEKVWGPKARYHVKGTINGRDVRGALEQSSRGHILPLGPAYRRGAGLHPDDLVAVTLMPDLPQSDSLAPDIVAALGAEPEAARFFDGLASFHLKNYLRWIDATRRSPDVRARRIAELVDLMKAGQKQRLG